MKRKLLLVSMLLLLMSARAQQSIYTLYQYTPMQINPAFSVLDHAAGLSFFHENFSVAAGSAVNTNSVNADLPFIQKETGRKLLGLGLSFYNKDTRGSDLLKTYSAGISVATPVQLTANQSLNFGVSAHYFNRRTSMENLSTGSQWIAQEFRYDPNVGLGEAFSDQNISYFSMGTGLIWQLQKNGVTHSSISFAMYDVNRPNESFFEGDARLPVTYLAHAQTVLYENRRVVLSPSLFYSRVNTVDTYKAFWSTKILFQNSNPYDIIRSGNFDLIVGYGFNKAASLGLILNQPGFSAGFAVNFPVASESQYLDNATQMGVTISKSLWKPSPKKVIIKSAPPKRTFDFEQKTRPEEQQVATQSEIEKIKAQLEVLDDVRSLQFELSKDFHFEFGEAKLSADAAPFISELYALLKDNPDFELKIIGHTDDVGKKQANYDLSIKRAQVVADELIRKGIDPSQITVIGRGDTEPLADNLTAEGRAKNRRVTFQILVKR